MTAIRFAPLLLLALLAAGCAAAAGTSAGTPAARTGDPSAPEVRFARVSSRSMRVQLAQPAHAAVLEIRPGALQVVRWLDERAVRRLEAGEHAFELGPRNPRLSSGSPCTRPGEYEVYDYESARRIAGARPIRELTHRGIRVYCVVTPSQGNQDRVVLVVVSPHPVEAGRLEELIAAFNTRYGGITVESGALPSVLADMLVSAWAGSAGYAVRIPH